MTNSAKPGKCSFVALYLLVFVALVLGGINFFHTLYRYRQIHRVLSVRERNGNASFDQLVAKMAAENARLRGQRDRDMAVWKEKFQDLRRTKNQPGSMESREMQLIREMKESFTSALRELNVKVC